MFMELINKFTRFFFSVEKRSRIGQLREDFGDFPPAPLRGDGVLGEFDIVRTCGIGEVWYHLKIQKRMLEGIESKEEDLSADFIAYFGNDELRVSRTALTGLGGSARFIKAVAVTLALSFTGIRLVFNMLRSTGQDSRKLGCFVPVMRQRSEIVIDVGRHARLGRSEAPTISHEHIHMLQHDDSEDRLRHARSPERLLNKKGLAKPFLLYLLEANEVEARLHESVLSFYRVHYRLPMTVSAFLGMLSASQQFGRLVGLELERGGVHFDRFQYMYPEREREYTQQLEFILLYIDTPELNCRFITEVLTVMYGNLLRYYGDETASVAFLSGIARPNLYDDLYGRQRSA